MKISILIPTRDRAKYIASSIRTILEIRDDDIEIVVNDNCSTDDTRNIITAITDPRVIYKNTGKRVSMRENFNQAVLNSTGDYLIAFGDDDGILAGQFLYLRSLLETHQPDGIIWDPVDYLWPETGQKSKGGVCRLNPSMAFSEPFGLDVRESNAKALFEGTLNKSKLALPSLYHGCMSRAYMDRIAPKKGLYFDSLIPDINIQYRSIIFGGNFIKVKHPFTISGVSRASTGRAYKNFDTHGQPANLFREENFDDPYTDLFEHEASIPMAFFATLETLRKRLVDNESEMLSGMEVNYRNWFIYCLREGIHNSQKATALYLILSEYAKTIGQLETLNDVKVNCAQSNLKERFLFRLERLKNKILRLRSRSNRLRVSAMQGGDNNVFTAAHCYDQLLGDGLGRVLRHEMTPEEAWQQARQRANFLTY